MKLWSNCLWLVRNWPKISLFRHHLDWSLQKYLNDAKIYFFCSHTYIIGHYNLSVRIIDLASHATYVVCFNFFIHKWRDLQFKVDSEREIFMAIFIYSQSFCQKSAEEKIAEEILFASCFDWCLVWSSNPSFSSNKPAHYLLEHGDFLCSQNLKVLYWWLKLKIFGLMKPVWKFFIKFRRMDA